jgi:flavin-dependent dehydrogenase
LNELKIKAKRDFFKKKITKAVFISKENKLEFSIEDYKLNRQAFLDEVIAKSKKKGARFYFETELLNVRKSGSHYELILKSGKKTVKTYADTIIGADGALSRVSEFIGRKKKFFIVSEAPAKKLPGRFDDKSWNVFLRKDFGYYAYRDYELAGVECSLGKNIKAYQKNFFSFLHLKKSKEIISAIVPKPAYLAQKGNIFLIGDAGGYAKFNGGGIIPSIESAIAARNILLNKDYGLFKKLSRSQRLNKLISKVLERMDEKDWQEMFKILKDRKFSKLVEERDELNFIKYFDFRLLKFLVKLI